MFESTQALITILNKPVILDIPSPITMLRSCVIVGVLACASAFVPAGPVTTPSHKFRRVRGELKLRLQLDL